MLGALAALSLSGSACDSGDEKAEDPVATFIGALPNDGTLELEVPGEEDVAVAGLPLAMIEAPLLGEPSDLRVRTGAVRRFLRQLIDNMTEGLDRLTDGSPTRRTADGAMWLVRFPDLGIDRALVMKREDGHFSYTIWTRAIGRPGDLRPWHFLLLGRVTPGRNGDVRGAMWLDLDKDRKPRSHGKVSVLWSVIGNERRIDVVVFDGTPDDGELGRLTRNYSYQDGPDGGRIAFDAGEVDVHIVADHQGLERVRVATRWNAQRRMRADYAAVGPEVRADGYRVLIGSECWVVPDPDVSYETRVAIPLAGDARVTLFERGDVGTCGFLVDEPPIVATPGAIPIEPVRPSELDEAP